MTDQGSYEHPSPSSILRTIALKGTFQLPRGTIDLYEDNLNNQVAKIHKHYMRKANKEAFNCSAKCCEANFASGDKFDNCVEACFTKMHDMKIYADVRLNKYNAKCIRCIRRCQISGKKLLKEGKFLEYDVYDQFNTCTDKCMGEQSFQMQPAIEQIIQGFNRMFL